MRNQPTYYEEKRWPKGICWTAAGLIGVAAWTGIIVAGAEIFKSCQNDVPETSQKTTISPAQIDRQNQNNR